MAKSPPSPTTPNGDPVVDPPVVELVDPAEAVDPVEPPDDEELDGVPPVEAAPDVPPPKVVVPGPELPDEEAAFPTVPPRIESCADGAGLEQADKISKALATTVGLHHMQANLAPAEWQR